MTDSALQPAFSALEDCAVALEKLDRLCCEPGRSPRMKALAETLGSVRANLEKAGHDTAAADVALVEMEDAGAQIGRLQVGCCAPARMPLYATFLEGLTSAQLAVNRSLERGH